MNKTYTGLHQHSVYSVLDGFAKIDKMVQRCKSLGFEGVAMTDHGNCFGWYDLKKACAKHDIKPIYGNEMYIAPESALVKEKVEGYKPAYHIIVLAMNDKGLDNLRKLTSWSWLEGKYYKPRCDWARLAEFNEGLIITSACLGGLPSQLFLEGKLEEAEDSIKKFKSIFGDRFYLELTHTGMEEQTRANNFLVRMAEKHSVELVITSDSHYVEKDEWDYHAALVSINTGGSKKKVKTDSDSKEDIDETGDGLFYQKEQYFIKDYEDLKKIYVEQHGEDFVPTFEKAMANTNDIAKRCNADFDEGMKIIPSIVDDPNKQLLVECTEFLKEYLEKLNIEEGSDKWLEYFDRLDTEYQVISKADFSDYFHVVAEYTQWAKDNGIMVGSGRGSAAGCLIAFCMRITGIDPIKYDLLFERFLNRGRSKRPVIEFNEYPMDEHLSQSE